MVNLTKEALQKAYKAHAHRSEIIFHGKNVNIAKNIVVDRKTVNIIAFNGHSFAAEAVARKNRYIELNEYLLTVSSGPGTEDVIDFQNACLYRIADGAQMPISLEVKTAVSCYAGSLVVIDEKLLAVCNKAHPKFIAVLGGVLRFVPSFAAEQIMRNMPLSTSQLKALIKLYPEEGWGLHNGIAINPDSYCVPSALQFYFWNRSRPAKTAVKANLDFSKLVSILTRSEKKEKPVVKFVKSENF